MFEIEIGKPLYYLSLIATLLILVGSYILIRRIIWSIAICDIGKKRRKSEEFQSKKNLSMSYLSEYVTTYQKEYRFWMRLKLVFVASECLILAAYLAISFTGWNLFLPYLLNFIQAFVWFFALRLQFDTNRDTKYDRIWNAKHNSK